MNHGGIRRGAVPVLLSRRDPYRVARADWARRFAPQRDKARAVRDIERLTQGMSVPVRSRAGLERHAGDPAIQQLFARLLSCSRDTAVRAPARALPLAERSFRAGPSIDGAETLAMALVSSGDRATGLDWQRQALQRAQTVGDRARAQAAAQRLELYEAGQECNAPWLGNGPN